MEFPGKRAGLLPRSAAGPLDPAAEVAAMPCSRGAGDLARGPLLLLLFLAMFVLATGGCRPPEGREPPPAPRPLPEPSLHALTFAEKRLTVCEVNLAEHRLELFWKDDGGAPFRSFSALDARLRGRGRKLLFAMNAGMYREDLSPVGLYVERGRQLRPLNLARGRSNFCLRPNGVFALTKSGAVVVESSRYPAIKAGVTLATQSGPMLVIDGRLHPAFSRQSTSRYLRNGVGVLSPKRVLFAISEEPVTFYEFATFFRDVLHCRNALYLDGAISSLYSAALNRNDARADLGPIIAVVQDPTPPAARPPTRTRPGTPPATR